MKKVLFGIALILFAIFLFLADAKGFFGADWLILLISLAGVTISGIGAFTKDE